MTFESSNRCHRQVLECSRRSETLGGIPEAVVAKGGILLNRQRDNHVQEDEGGYSISEAKETQYEARIHEECVCQRIKKDQDRSFAERNRRYHTSLDSASA